MDLTVVIAGPAIAVLSSPGDLRNKKFGGWVSQICKAAYKNYLSFSSAED